MRIYSREGLVPDLNILHPQEVENDIPGVIVDPKLFLVWNIAGLVSKCNDPAWVKFVKQFLVINLQETWSVECDLFLEGYRAFFIPATPLGRG